MDTKVNVDMSMDTAAATCTLFNVVTLFASSTAIWLVSGSLVWLPEFGPEITVFSCLRSYALYLAGEKRKEEEIAEVQDPAAWLLCDPWTRYPEKTCYPTRNMAVC